MSEGTAFHRAYRYRLRSNCKAEAVLRRWAGCSRKVWNLALAGDGQALVEGQVQSDRPVKREPTEERRRLA